MPDILSFNVCKGDFFWPIVGIKLKLCLKFTFLIKIVHLSHHTHNQNFD